MSTGPACSTPTEAPRTFRALIRSLVSSDPEARKQAHYDAFGNIWHQGTIYEATVEAVPFLVRIAVTAGVPGRGRVVELLAAIAAGTGYVSVHRNMMTGLDEWERRRT